MSSTGNPMINCAETDAHSRQNFGDFDQELANLREKEEQKKREYNDINKNGDENGVELEEKFKDIACENGRLDITLNEVSGQLDFES